MRDIRYVTEDEQITLKVYFRNNKFVTSFKDVYSYQKKISLIILLQHFLRRFLPFFYSSLHINHIVAIEFSFYNSHQKIYFSFDKNLDEEIYRDDCETPVFSSCLKRCYVIERTIYDASNQEILANAFSFLPINAGFQYYEKKKSEFMEENYKRKMGIKVLIHKSDNPYGLIFLEKLMSAIYDEEKNNFYLIKNAPFFNQPFLGVQFSSPRRLSRSFPSNISIQFLIRPLFEAQRFNPLSTPLSMIFSLITIIFIIKYWPDQFQFLSTIGFGLFFLFSFLLEQFFSYGIDTSWKNPFNIFLHFDEVTNYQSPSTTLVLLSPTTSIFSEHRRINEQQGFMALVYKSPHLRIVTEHMEDGRRCIIHADLVADCQNEATAYVRVNRFEEEKALSFLNSKSFNFFRMPKEKIQRLHENIDNDMGKRFPYSRFSAKSGCVGRFNKTVEGVKNLLGRRESQDQFADGLDSLSPVNCITWVKSVVDRSGLDSGKFFRASESLGARVRSMISEAYELGEEHFYNQQEDKSGVKKQVLSVSSNQY